MVKLVFWDVQHGHACYVQTESKHMIIDLGTGSYGQSGKEFSPLKHLKYKYRVDQLDAAIITHPHSDHLYDIFNFGILNPRILVRPKHLSDQELREGNTREDNPYVEKYIQISNGYNTDVEGAENPFLPQNNGGVQIQFFSPRKCARSNLNNHSVVSVISHARSKIIIPGDNESPSWDELLESQVFIESIRNTDIILAPHHGRDAGYSSNLFKYISPHLTIISDGSETDTSATDRYSKESKGWHVNSRAGGKVERKCVTTRKDGVILVELGLSPDGRAYMSVTIN